MSHVGHEAPGVDRDGMTRQAADPIHVVHVIDSLSPSGAERSLLTMIPHLKAGGVRMEVIHFGADEGIGSQIEALGVPAMRLGVHRLGDRVGALRTRLDAIRPDLVHTTLFQADVAGRIAATLAGVPVVSSLVNVAYGPEQREVSPAPRWKLEVARAIDAATARLARRFHAISRTVAYVMGRRLLLPTHRIDVVPRGREPADLGERTPDRRERVRRELGLGGEPVVLTAARHEPQKGLEVAVEAFARVRADHPSAVLLMAGREGTASDVLRRAVAHHGLGDEVRILGRRDDVPDLLVAADVLCFPSRWEGLGGVLLEAMALETPIVATDLPAVREILMEDGSELAWFVPVDDAERLAAALCDVLDGSSSRTAVARRRFMRHFTAEQAAAGIISFYLRALHHG